MSYPENLASQKAVEDGQCAGDIVNRGDLGGPQEQSTVPQTSDNCELRGVNAGCHPGRSNADQAAGNSYTTEGGSGSVSAGNATGQLQAYANPALCHNSAIPPQMMMPINFPAQPNQQFVSQMSQQWNLPQIPSECLLSALLSRCYGNLGNSFMNGALLPQIQPGNGDPPPGLGGTSSVLGPFPVTFTGPNLSNSSQPTTAMVRPAASGTESVNVNPVGLNWPQPECQDIKPSITPAEGGQQQYHITEQANYDCETCAFKQDKPEQAVYNIPMKISPDQRRAELQGNTAKLGQYVTPKLRNKSPGRPKKLHFTLPQPKYILVPVDREKPEKGLYNEYLQQEADTQVPLITSSDGSQSTGSGKNTTGCNKKKPLYNHSATGRAPEHNSNAPSNSTTNYTAHNPNPRTTEGLNRPPNPKTYAKVIDTWTLPGVKRKCSVQVGRSLSATNTDKTARIAPIKATDHESPAPSTQPSTTITFTAKREVKALRELTDYSLNKRDSSESCPVLIANHLIANNKPPEQMASSNNNMKESFFDIAQHLRANATGHGYSILSSSRPAVLKPGGVNTNQSPSEQGETKDEGECGDLASVPSLLHKSAHALEETFNMNSISPECSQPTTEEYMGDRHPNQMESYLDEYIRTSTPVSIEGNHVGTLGGSLSVCRGDASEIPDNWEQLSATVTSTDTQQRAALQNSTNPGLELLSSVASSQQRIESMPADAGSVTDMEGDWSMIAEDGSTNQTPVSSNISPGLNSSWNTTTTLTTDEITHMAESLTKREKRMKITPRLRKRVPGRREMFKGARRLVVQLEAVVQSPMKRNNNPKNRQTEDLNSNNHIVNSTKAPSRCLSCSKDFSSYPSLNKHITSTACGQAYEKAMQYGRNVAAHLDKLKEKSKTANECFRALSTESPRLTRGQSGRLLELLSTTDSASDFSYKVKPARKGRQQSHVKVLNFDTDHSTLKPKSNAQSEVAVVKRKRGRPKKSESKKQKVNPQIPKTTTLETITEASVKKPAKVTNSLVESKVKICQDGKSQALQTDINGNITGENSVPNKNSEGDDSPVVNGPLDQFPAEVPRAGSKGTGDSHQKASTTQPANLQCITGLSAALQANMLPVAQQSQSSSFTQRTDLPSKAPQSNLPLAALQASRLSGAQQTKVLSSSLLTTRSSNALQTNLASTVVDPPLTGQQTKAQSSAPHSNESAKSLPSDFAVTSLQANCLSTAQPTSLPSISSFLDDFQLSDTDSDNDNEPEAGGVDTTTPNYVSTTGPSTPLSTNDFNEALLMLQKTNVNLLPEKNTVHASIVNLSLVKDEIQPTGTTNPEQNLQGEKNSCTQAKGKVTAKKSGTKNDSRHKTGRAKEQGQKTITTFTGASGVKFRILSQKPPNPESKKQTSKKKLLDPYALAICKHCKEVVSRIGLTQHIEDKHKFRCKEKDCFKYFASLEHLKLHKQAEHAKKKFPCELCEKVYVSLAAFFKHFSGRQHKQLENAQQKAIQQFIEMKRVRTFKTPVIESLKNIGVRPSDIDKILQEGEKTSIHSSSFPEPVVMESRAAIPSTSGDSEHSGMNTTSVINNLPFNSIDDKATTEVHVGINSGNKAYESTDSAQSQLNSSPMGAPVPCTGYGTPGLWNFAHDSALYTNALAFDAQINALDDMSSGYSSTPGLSGSQLDQSDESQQGTKQTTYTTLGNRPSNSQQSAMGLLDEILAETTISSNFIGGSNSERNRTLSNMQPFGHQNMANNVSFNNTEMSLSEVLTMADQTLMATTEVYSQNPVGEHNLAEQRDNTPLSDCTVNEYLPAIGYEKGNQTSTASNSRHTGNQLVSPSTGSQCTPQTLDSSLPLEVDSFVAFLQGITTDEREPTIYQATLAGNNREAPLEQCPDGGQTMLCNNIHQSQISDSLLAGSHGDNSPNIPLNKSTTKANNSNALVLEEDTDGICHSEKSVDTEEGANKLGTEGTSSFLAKPQAEKCSEERPLVVGNKGPCNEIPTVAEPSSELDDDIVESVDSDDEPLCEWLLNHSMIKKEQDEVNQKPESGDEAGDDQSECSDVQEVEITPRRKLNMTVKKDRKKRLGVLRQNKGRNNDAGRPATGNEFILWDIVGKEENIRIKSEDSTHRVQPWNTAEIQGPKPLINETVIIISSEASDAESD